MTKTLKFRHILTKEFLSEEHVQKKISLHKIAQKLNIDHKTVKFYLELHGLPHQEPYRGNKGAAHGMWRGYGEISHTYWRNIEANAKRRKIIYSLTIQEGWELYLKQNRRCALSGREIGFLGCTNNTASIDRIDSSKAYEIGNVQWVHKDVNFAKQSLSVKEFRLLCCDVCKHLT